jgi:hypothetical protein
MPIKARYFFAIAALAVLTSATPQLRSAAEAGQCQRGTKFVKNYGCVPKSVIRQAKKLCAPFQEPASFCIVSNGPGEFHAQRITD